MINLYGPTLALAIFVSYYLTAYQAKKRGLSAQVVWDSLPWVLVFGIIGARLYHVVNYWNYYSQNPVWVLEVWRGGLGILGALAGGLVGLTLYFKSFSFRRPEFSSSSVILSEAKDLDSSGRTPQNDGRGVGMIQLSSYLDAAAPAIILGQAIGRVGNVFNEENLPYSWWEIITNLFIFGFLILVERFVNSKEDGSRITSGMTNSGYLFFLYLFSYALSRFFLEFFRTDSPWVWGPLTVAQWVCLVVISVLIFSFIKTGSARSPLSHQDHGFWS